MYQTVVSLTMGTISNNHIFFTAVIVCVVLSTAHGQGYNYNRNEDTQGVYNWGSAYPGQCDGPFQSPIDINLGNVFPLHSEAYNLTTCSCPLLQYKNPRVHVTFKNSGHSPKCTVRPTEDVILSNVPYRTGTYKLNGFHLHYGGTTYQPLSADHHDHMTPGSEHTIDGMAYDGEIHFVFINNGYETVFDALEDRDNIVVLAFMIQQTDRPTSESRQFSEFLRRNTPRILNVGSKMKTRVDLNMFFNRRCEYYTYHGSLTTPPCSEDVRWIIFKEPIQVSPAAWAKLGSLDSVGNSNTRYGNYRDSQPLNGRIIEANFGPSDVCGFL